MPTGGLELPGDPGDITRTNTGQTQGGGGIPPGPPGSFAAGAYNPFALNPGGFGAAGLPPRRLGANPYVGGADTVPAMLQPGEFVVNSQAAGQPDIAQLLMLLNQMGGQGGQQHMAGGGFAEPVRCYACGGYVADHMAAGGFAGFGQQQMGRGYGGGPGGHAGGGGWSEGGGWSRPPTTPMPNNSPGLNNSGEGFGAGAPLNPGMQWNPAWGANPGGPQQSTPPPGWAPGTWDPYAPQFNGQGWNSNGAQSNAYQWLTDFMKSGAFSPGGSQGLLNATSQNAKMNADALNQRTSNAADLYGLDPGQAASAKMQGVLQGNNQYADTMNNANLGVLQNQQQLGQNLLGQMLGYNNQYELNNQGYLHNQLLQNQQNGGGMNWGGVLGSVAGAGIGSLFGPGGAAVGANIGGRLHP